MGGGAALRPRPQTLGICHARVPRRPVWDDLPGEPARPRPVVSLWLRACPQSTSGGYGFGGMGCGSVVAGKIPTARLLRTLPAGGWVGAASEARLSWRGHPPHHPGLAWHRACPRVCCKSPTVTLSPSTLLAVPNLHTSPDWRAVRDPQGFSPSPLPPSLSPARA